MYKKLAYLSLTILVLSSTLIPFSVIYAQSTSSTTNSTNNGVGLGQGIVSTAGSVIQKGTSAALGAALSCSGVDTAITSSIKGLFGSVTSVSKVPTGNATLEDIQQCQNGIAYAVAKTALATITEKTVNWINSGFKGNPLFVQNVGSYTQSIWDQQVTDFTTTLTSDAAKYPYGTSFAQSFITSAKGYFAKNAQYTLQDRLTQAHPGVTVNQYRNDFSKGGWDTWFAETQVPQNNPVGFYIDASQEIANRVDGLLQTPGKVVSDELARGKGFLDQKKCVGTWDNGSYNAAAEANMLKQLNDDKAAGKDTTTIANDNTEYHNVQCRKWETVTPGSVIADQINVTLGSSVRQLELADQINESLADVFNALTNQLVNKGLSSLETASAPSNVDFGGVGDNSSITIAGNTNSDVPWQSFEANSINLETDLPGLIQTQQDAIDAIAPIQAKLGLIIQDTYYADYCVPGPRPTWESDLDQAVEQNIADVKKKQADKDSTIGGQVLHTVESIYNTVTLGLGNIVLGALGLNSDTKITEYIITIDEARAEYKANIKGTHFHEDDPNGSVDFVTSGYKMTLLPSVTSAIFNEFQKIPDFQSINTEYSNRVDGLHSAKTELIRIQNQVTAIDTSTTMTTAQKELARDRLRNILVSIAPEMATQGTIDTITNSGDTLDAEDAKVHDLLAACSAEINDPSYIAQLKSARGSDGTNELDNWLPDPYVSNYDPYPDVHLPQPTQNGSGGDHGLATFAPWRRGIQATGISGIKTSLMQLDSTFAYFEATFGMW